MEHTRPQFGYIYEKPKVSPSIPKPVSDTWPPRPLNIPKEIPKHGPSQIAPEENTYNDTHDCARCRFLRATCKLHEEITKERS